MSSGAIRWATVAIAFFNVIALILANWAIAASCDSYGCAARIRCDQRIYQCIHRHSQRKRKKKKEKKKFFLFCLSVFSWRANVKIFLFFAPFFFQLIRTASSDHQTDCTLDADSQSNETDDAADVACGVAAASHALTKSSLSGAMLRFFMMARSIGPRELLDDASSRCRWAPVESSRLSPDRRLEPSSPPATVVPCCRLAVASFAGAKRRWWCKSSAWSRCQRQLVVALTSAPDDVALGAAVVVPSADGAGGGRQRGAGVAGGVGGIEGDGDGVCSFSPVVSESTSNELLDVLDEHARCWVRRRWRLR
jgi:hypothetical protein